MHFFLHIGQLFSSGRGFFLALSAAGQAGDPRVLTAQVWAPARLRGASRCSKSQNLASNHGIAFRPARANQAHRNPQSVFFLRFSPLSAATSGVKQQPSKALSGRGTTAALLAFPIKTGTNGASACVFVSVCACHYSCLLYTSPSPRDLSTSRMPSSA